MQDFISRLGVQFSDEEKRECFSVARRMVELARITEKHGILALESEMIFDNDFMRVGICLILDGTPPDLIEKIFQHLLSEDRYKGVALLERLLIAEGALAIAKGANLTEAVTAIVGAMLDEKYTSEILLDITNKKIDVNFLIDEYTSALPESVNFEKRLLKLTRLELSYVLMTTNLISLATALKGCNRSFIHHMKSGLLEDNFIQLCRLFQWLTPQTHKEAILVFQSSILYYLEQLEVSGVFTETFE